MLLFGQTLKIYIKLDFVYFMYINLGHLCKDPLCKDRSLQAVTCDSFHVTKNITLLSTCLMKSHITYTTQPLSCPNFFSSPALACHSKAKHSPWPGKVTHF